MLYILRLFI